MPNEFAMNKETFLRYCEEGKVKNIYAGNAGIVVVEVEERKRILFGMTLEAAKAAKEAAEQQ